MSQLYVSAYMLSHKKSAKHAKLPMSSPSSRLSSDRQLLRSKSSQTTWGYCSDMPSRYHIPYLALICSVSCLELRHLHLGRLGRQWQWQLSSTLHVPSRHHQTSRFLRFHSVTLARARETDTDTWCAWAVHIVVLCRSLRVRL